MMSCRKESASPTVTAMGAKNAKEDAEGLSRRGDA